ncbi:hypothetical protein OS493_033649 [Desmophyllum pertusum]|uniref:Uncharacterized protein n=1 Tax=Desmophyllum pertusum TaxID=174260 RepID=A0A9W9Y832_9CNID|nr:hypothetical protein OS493_033649 [Desmophyllum pertusum]
MQTFIIKTSQEQQTTTALVVSEIVVEPSKETTSPEVHISKLFSGSGPLHCVSPQ